MPPRKPRYGISEFLAAIPVPGFDGRPRYYVLVHSGRCNRHLAHPVSVMQAREMLYSALVGCSDPECFVTLGEVVTEMEHGVVKQSDARRAHQTETGKPYGYISRKERQGIAFSDPKRSSDLVNWMARQRRQKEEKVAP